MSFDPAEPKTLTIPEAGQRYYGLSRNGSYEAAARGEIPYIRVGRLKRVPIALMERMMQGLAPSPYLPLEPPAAPRGGAAARRKARETRGPERTLVDTS